jgi:hypothetical protein
MASSHYWIKLYIEILDDPKVGMMPEWLFARMIKLFLVAKEYNQDGLLPPVSALAWRLRMDAGSLSETLSALGLIGVVREMAPEIWLIVNFKKRQEAESSTERSQRFRKRKCNETLPIMQRSATITSSSASSSSSDSLEEEGVQGEGKPPGDLRTFERIWQQATGMATFLGGSREQDIPRIEAIFARNGRNLERTVAELRRYFDVWCNTTSPKTKRKYSRSNSGWLDWAVAGEVPASSNGKKPHEEYDYERLKKIAQKEGL